MAFERLRLGAHGTADAFDLCAIGRVRGRGPHEGQHIEGKRRRGRGREGVRNNRDVERRIVMDRTRQRVSVIETARTFTCDPVLTALASRLGLVLMGLPATPERLLEATLAVRPLGDAERPFGDDERTLEANSEARTKDRSCLSAMKASMGWRGGE